MDDLMIVQVDCETGEEIVRPMTPDESAAHVADAEPTVQEPTTDPRIELAQVIADAADPIAALKTWAADTLKQASA